MYNIHCIYLLYDEYTQVKLTNNVNLSMKHVQKSVSPLSKVWRPLFVNLDREVVEA